MAAFSSPPCVPKNNYTIPSCVALVQSKFDKIELKITPERPQEGYIVMGDPFVDGNKSACFWTIQQKHTTTYTANLRTHNFPEINRFKRAHNVTTVIAGSTTAAHPDQLVDETDTPHRPVRPTHTLAQTPTIPNLVNPNSQ